MTVGQSPLRKVRPVHLLGVDEHPKAYFTASLWLSRSSEPWPRGSLSATQGPLLHLSSLLGKALGTSEHRQGRAPGASPVSTGLRAQ